MLKTCFCLFFVVWVNVGFSEQIIDTTCILEQSGASGKCRLLTDCKEVRDEILTHHHLPKTCGFQGTQPIVCCPLVKKPGYISKQKCREYSSYAYDGSSEKYGCEHSIRKRIVGGESVGRKEFSHSAALGFQDGKNEISWKCGGLIISEQYILTVAHCLINKKIGPPTLVRVGVTSLNDTDHRQDLKVAEVLAHPDYKDFNNDIGLVKLEKPIQLNAYAIPACLYTDTQISFDSAIATGWGRTESGYSANDLQKVTLKIVDSEVCNATLKRIISDSQLCAGIPSERKDTCQGDAGGPLQVHHEGDAIKCMYDIIGVTSFGAKICNGGPSIYTRVSHYIQWIEDIVWKSK